MIEIKMNYVYSTETVKFGTRLNKHSKITAILQYLKDHGPASKYDIVTNVLGKTGSRNQLRGYYSVYFQTCRKVEILTLDKSTHKYALTDLGYKVLSTAKARG